MPFFFFSLYVMRLNNISLKTQDRVGGETMTLETIINTLDSNTNSHFSLNKYAVATAIDKNEILNQMRILRMHGVSTPLTYNDQIKSNRYRTIYLLPIFQQKLLGIYKQSRYSSDNWVNSALVRNNQKIYIERFTKFPSKREENRVTEQATHAVYALGLDYALVKIGMIEGSKPLVLFVNPFPDTNQDIKDLLNGAINEFQSNWDHYSMLQSKNVIIGADPEFVLESVHGGLVLASTYLPKYGVAGCDQIWTNRDRTQLPIAELRPKPEGEPRGFVINLYKSMLVASKRIKNKNHKWLAGALPIPGYPIGGHIHFSNIWLNSFLIRAFDNYLTLLITLFEDKRGINRRPKYGFLGDVREQFHGGFEYRTPPSWIVNPTVTKGIIALSKLISENYFYLYQNPLKDIHVQAAYYKGDKDTLRPIVENLWKELKQLNDFSLYKKYLLPLEILIKNGYLWNEKEDIRKAWLLPPYNKKNL